MKNKKMTRDEIMGLIDYWVGYYENRIDVAMDNGDGDPESRKSIKTLKFLKMCIGEIEKERS